MSEYRFKQGSRIFVVCDYTLSHVIVPTARYIIHQFICRSTIWIYMRSQMATSPVYIMNLRFTSVG